MAVSNKVGKQKCSFKNNTVQRRSSSGRTTLGGAKMGELVNCLGKPGRRPSLLCVAVKRKLNGIAFKKYSGGLLEAKVFHLAFPGFLLAVVAFSGGCQLCCPPYMDDYATVGGRWARANPTDGRVGSAFSDPGVIQASALSTPTMEWHHSESQPSPVMDFPQDSTPEDLDDWNNPLREGKGSSIIVLE